MALPIARLSYENLRSTANTFLKTHCPGEIPVPIEEIVEFKFGINVIPIPGLLEIHEVDAFVSQDLKTIMVDNSVMESHSPNRYRFSLAHELAHVILHAEVFSAVRFTSLGQWRKLLASFPEEDRSWLEWQAHGLAGLVLVPGDCLSREVRGAVTAARKRGVKLLGNEDVAKAYISTHLGRVFEVSAEVINRRMDKDNLWPPEGRLALPHK